MTADQPLPAARNRKWDMTLRAQRTRTRRAPAQRALRRGLAPVLALAATATVLAGCSGTSGAGASGRAPVAGARSMAGHDSMAGMVMPEAGNTAGGPTATQKMVCDGEIKAAVKTVLKLPATPTPTSSFAGGKFTCIYDLPMGPMRLSVQHSSTAIAALAYLKSRAIAVSATESLIGLTDHAYGTSTGVVLVVKDNETLEVDTSALPEVFGDEQQKRTDLAYEIASDVLGCWTGHDGQ